MVMAQQPYSTVVGYNYKNITSGTNVVKATPGMLASLVVNSVTSGAVITIYDNTAGSGTVIAIPTLLTTSNTPFKVDYNANFTTGLTVVVTSGTANITVVYR
jgi:hypothetical protein